MNEAPLRVCFVIQKLFNLTGGAERVFLQAAAAMASRNMIVEVLVFDRTNGTPRFVSDGLRITNLMPTALRSKTPAGDSTKGDRTPGILARLPNKGLVAQLKYTATHGVFAHRLTTALRHKRPDVIVGFLPPAILAATRAGRALGVPVIASTHNVLEQDFGLQSPRWDQNTVYRRRARNALAQASAITVLQDTFLDWFTPEERQRAVVLPNPISRLSPEPVPQPERAKQVLSVGRLTAIKRHALLIDAWARIAPEFPDWQVSIYGDGPEKDALSAGILSHGLQDRIMLHGTLPDLGPVYDRASLLCHPSAFEGFGLAVAEAMAHGTPALGFSDCPGINQLITDQKDGWLIDPGNAPVEALAAALRKTLKNTDDMRAKGRAAREILHRFSPEAFASSWESLIRRTAAEGPSKPTA